MKVAYNRCAGGFGLSAQAEKEFFARKGIDLTFYKGVGAFPYEKLQRIDDVSYEAIGRVIHVGVHASTKDLGPSITEIPSQFFHIETYEELSTRSDPDLIETIEGLGVRSFGYCSKLAIVDIPNNLNFDILNFNGVEEIVLKKRITNQIVHDLRKKNDQNH